MRVILSKLYKKPDNFYTELSELPLWNWFKVQETGDLKYFFIDYENAREIPIFFEQLLINMLEQFERVDNAFLRLKADALYYESKYLTTGKSSWLMESKAVEEKIKNIGNSGLSLEDFLNYIEITFKQLGSLDANKISTKRAYSLYHKALDINSKKISGNGTN